MDEIKAQLLDLSTNAEVALGEWIISLVILLVLVTAIKWVYIKRSNTVSNKILFSNTFYAFALAIFLIITSIKASLALSLGLVGALSIVRFRTAIKEPEQLVYLLMIIGVSISLAAQQLVPSIIITLMFLIWQFSIKQGNTYINKDLMNISFQFASNEKMESVFELLRTIDEINGFEKIKTSENLADLTLSISAMKDSSFMDLKSKLEQQPGIDQVEISFISSLTF
ncbi:MAG: DUF4956 domain-containing protein [Bacteroidia bacterium]|nr:DUF4956 domain-containing protein [Bacteroidia bacterium]MBT8278500.1 DUF4956 domain-containing protein [Bacteroidia bacterium]NNK59110.1 DUF4956 domain-containing protein [Flavobacteriaceae bacterium]NNL31965.1 DUF4956 domain-containing protein [Flavobacteriaceae bacterium]